MFVLCYQCIVMDFQVVVVGGVVQQFDGFVVFVGGYQQVGYMLVDYVLQVVFDFYVVQGGQCFFVFVGVDLGFGQLQCCEVVVDVGWVGFECFDCFGGVVKFVLLQVLQGFLVFDVG